MKKLIIIFSCILIFSVYINTCFADNTHQIDTISSSTNQPLVKPNLDSFTWPTVTSNQISLQFGEIDNINLEKHAGIDIQGNLGDEIVSAV